MSAEVSIEHQLPRLNTALQLYVRATGKTVEDVLRKKGAQLGYALRQEFRGLMPVKGTVRSERLAALKAGEGVYIRPSVRKEMAEKYQIAPAGGPALFRKRAGRKAYAGFTLIKGKRMNLQALAVQRELNVRESGRGFLAQSSRFSFARQMSDLDKAVSRYGPVLAQAGFTTTTEGGMAQLKWGGFSKLSDEAVKAMGRVKGQAAIARALKVVTEDMEPYLARHLGEAAVGLLK